MNKTDLQKQFEEEQDREAVADFPHGKIYLPAYGEWCEHKVLNLMDKAAAYDRLMSGGKKTLKEFANLLGRAVAVDANGDIASFAGEPIRDLYYGFWYCDEDDEDYEEYSYLIPKDIVDYIGDWEDSLTLPDGWEEK